MQQNISIIFLCLVFTLRSFHWHMNFRSSQINSSVNDVLFMVSIVDEYLSIYIISKKFKKKTQFVN